eukprot:2503561-Lingulodinium_polyedra.AAC.2
MQGERECSKGTSRTQQDRHATQSLTARVRSALFSFNLGQGLHRSSLLRPVCSPSAHPYGRRNWTSILVPSGLGEHDEHAHD